MKLYFIFLSILASVLTWWWHSRPELSERSSATRFRSPWHRLTRSVIAGIAVYFGLMALAMIWLLITT